MSSKRGFTLIELMVVVAVLGIIAAIAVPAYEESVRKGKRAEAVRAIGEIQMRQERYRADNPLYGSMDQLTGSAANTTAYNNGLSYYSLSISSFTATGYRVTATRKGQLASDPKCANFVLTYSAGASSKSMSNNANVDYCWRQ